MFFLLTSQKSYRPAHLSFRCDDLPRLSDLCHNQYHSQHGMLVPKFPSPRAIALMCANCKSFHSRTSKKLY